MLTRADTDCPPFLQSANISSILRSFTCLSTALCVHLRGCACDFFFAYRKNKKTQAVWERKKCNLLNLPNCQHHGDKRGITLLLWGVLLALSVTCVLLWHTAWLARGNVLYLWKKHKLPQAGVLYILFYTTLFHPICVLMDSSSHFPSTHITNHWCWASVDAVWVGAKSRQVTLYSHNPLIAFPP